MSAARLLRTRYSDQHIIVFGAGAAGLGITQQLRAAMVADGVSPEVARQRVGVIDSRGLLVDDKPQSEEYKKELAWTAATAAQYGLSDPAKRDLATVIRQFKPTVLIGTSGIGQAFSESIVREMASYSTRPVILPLSNPTENAEATPADLLAWTEGRCLCATGSPFEPVRIGSRTVHISQGNNAFVFPGLGLGVLVGEVKRVTPGVLAAAARALANIVTQEELDAGMLFPRIARLPEAARAVAEAVVAAAGQEGIGRLIPAADIPGEVAKATWTPEYPELVAV
jgi:malate dehydrogenase (oxaloacetate-decarboxylating)